MLKVAAKCCRCGQPFRFLGAPGSFLPDAPHFREGKRGDIKATDYNAIYLPGVFLDDTADPDECADPAAAKE